MFSPFSFSIEIIDFLLISAIYMKVKTFCSCKCAQNFFYFILNSSVYAMFCTHAVLLTPMPYLETQQICVGSFGMNCMATLLMLVSMAIPIITPMWPCLIHQEQRLKEMGGSPGAPPANTNQSNPFASPTTGAPPVPSGGVDLFGSPTKMASPGGPPSDDLLHLSGNPFIENVQTVMQINNAMNNMQSAQQPFAPNWNSAPINTAAGRYLCKILDAAK